MVAIHCSNCDHAWNSKSHSATVTCSNCGSRIQIKSEVTRKGSKKGNNGGSSFGVTNWGGFKSSDSGMLSNWGGF